MTLRSHVAAQRDAAVEQAEGQRPRLRGVERVLVGARAAPALDAAVEAPHPLGRRPHAVARVEGGHAHQQRVAPGRDVVEVRERDVRVLAQRRLDPVLLRLVHRDPVGARRHPRPGRAAPAEHAGVREPERRLQPVDLDVHPPQPLHQLAHVAELRGRAAGSRSGCGCPAPGTGRCWRAGRPRWAAGALPRPPRSAWRQMFAQPSSTSRGSARPSAPSPTACGTAGRRAARSARRCPSRRSSRPRRSRWRARCRRSP